MTTESKLRLDSRIVIIDTVTTRGRDTAVHAMTARVFPRGYSTSEDRTSWPSHTVRVTITRDNYIQQSHAVAEVFNPALTWTNVMFLPVEDWFDKISSPQTYQDDKPGLKKIMDKIARELLHRTAVILPDPTETT